MAKNLKMTFGYKDTEFTRGYNFSVADSIEGDAAKTVILGINDSLKNGTAGGLSTFFVSDAGENFTLITAAQLEETNTQVLNLNINVDDGDNP